METNENLDFSLKINEKHWKFWYFIVKMFYLDNFIKNTAETRRHGPAGPTAAPRAESHIFFGKVTFFFLQMADMHAQPRDPAHM